MINDGEIKLVYLTIIHFIKYNMVDSPQNSPFILPSTTFRLFWMLLSKLIV